ncbi:hypothetical protein [Rhizomonospora bruguierae]|uniref:hypothetical protein n=1 Tax=Rhizomonospora bruguierae TaxID=1581705 RepID=UPI001BCC522F|nr:hypothetical protein [Micromonospora sp. NBRC 107566]
MRGDLDDALARMARRDEMLRRARAASGCTPAVTEVTEALRRVVAERPELVVTVRVHEERSVSEARVAWRDGEVRVTMRPASDGPYPRPPDEPRATNGTPARHRDDPGTAAARLADLLRAENPER